MSFAIVDEVVSFCTSGGVFAAAAAAVKGDTLC